MGSRSGRKTVKTSTENSRKAVKKVRYLSPKKKRPKDTNQFVKLEFCDLFQYVSGAISAPDLVRSLERDVAGKIPGCDLEDAVAAALEATPDKRKRDLLSKARYALHMALMLPCCSTCQVFHVMESGSTKQPSE